MNKAKISMERDLGKNLAELLLLEEELESKKKSVFVWSIFVGCGNVALMWLLHRHPLPIGDFQLQAGLVAMVLHGWAAWEIGGVLRHWAMATGDLATSAAEVVNSNARAHWVKPK